MTVFVIKLMFVVKQLCVANDILQIGSNGLVGFHVNVGRKFRPWLILKRESWPNIVSS